MKIFVTGSTGYVGTAIVAALVKAGHQVTGLLHNPEKEGLLKSLGATPFKGGLEAVDEWKEKAAQHEAVLHAGFAKEGNPPETDKKVVETLLPALQAGGVTQSFVYTSGIWVLGNTQGKAVDESGPTDKAFAMVVWRPAIEQTVLKASSRQFSTAVIRPGLVYGGKAGILAMLWGGALKDGAATTVGDGQNHWPMIHRDDLAQLYRLVAEKRGTGIFHGVDGVPVKYAEVAQAVSKAAGKGRAVKSWPLEEAKKTMGPFAEALVLDQVVAAKRSNELGWKCAHASFASSAAGAFKEFQG